MTNELVERANALHGCLSHLRTERGRRKDKDDVDLLTMSDDFASDEARITSSKVFRLLPLKTQVLTAPGSPFIRTRMSHVMEVVADSVVVSDMLGLNTSLVRAIALGHDMGHVPFGHPGEHYLAEHMGKKGVFCHEILGPLVTQKIERQGRGLNLTFETLEGMMCHSGNKAREGMTQEAWVVRYVDKIAYIFADYNDMVKRFGYPIPTRLKVMMDKFGLDHRERTSTAMCGLIIESAERGQVSFEHSDIGRAFSELRREMYEHYGRVTQQDLGVVIEPVLEFLAGLGIGDKYLLFSLLTDRDVQFLHEQKSKNFEHLRNTALGERLPYLDRLGKIDLCDPYLDW